MTRGARLAIGLLAFALGLSAGRLLAADQPRPKYPEPSQPSIEPVNVPVSYVVVSGTVTVRAAGVAVTPQQITYAFQPEFPGSSGYLYRVGDGLYRLENSRVPADAFHTLLITGLYNDTLVQGDVVQRLGQTYSGTLRIDVPNGRDYDFGDQILDLR